VATEMRATCGHGIAAVAVAQIGIWYCCSRHPFIQTTGRTSYSHQDEPYMPDGAPNRRGPDRVPMIACIQDRMRRRACGDKGQVETRWGRMHHWTGPSYPPRPPNGAQPQREAFGNHLVLPEKRGRESKSEMWLSPVWNKSRVRVPDVDTRVDSVTVAAAIAGTHAAATIAANKTARPARSPRRHLSSRPRCSPHPPVLALRRRQVRPSRWFGITVRHLKGVNSI